jgi:hypothetical protein
MLFKEHGRANVETLKSISETRVLKGRELLEEMGRPKKRKMGHHKRTKRPSGGGSFMANFGLIRFSSFTVRRFAY